MSSDSPESVLRNIQQRVEILSEVHDGIEDKRDLSENLSMSRSTINRAIRELTELNIVQEQAGNYKLTLYGKNMYESYCEFIELYKKLVKVKPLLLHLPSSFPFDYNILRTATVCLSERPNPHKPFTALQEGLEIADKIQVLSPVVNPRSVHFYHSEITEHNLTAEFILSQSVLDYLRTEHPAKIQTALHKENITFNKISKEITFGMVIIDSTKMWFSVYDDRGRIVGSITNNTQTAIEWAKLLYDDYKKDSNTVPSSNKRIR